MGCLYHCFNFHDEKCFDQIMNNKKKHPPKKKTYKKKQQHKNPQQQQQQKTSILIARIAWIGMLGPGRNERIFQHFVWAINMYPIRMKTLWGVSIMISLTILNAFINIHVFGNDKWRKRTFTIVWFFNNLVYKCFG